MKRLIKSAKKRSSYLIIGFLLLANLLAFGLASHYLGANSNMQSKATEQEEGMLETGWQVLGWGYSLLEYIKYEPPT